MQSRRDHLHAYEFAIGRLASALVTGETGTGHAPMRRANLGSMLGVLVTVLLTIGFVVFGFLSPGGNTAWGRPGSIVVEKETGTRYLYLGGVLRPTANYASALLAVGDQATVRIVSRKSLSGVRHGAPIGIPGAPDVLPQEPALLTGAWSFCLHPGIPKDRVIDFSPDGHAEAVPPNRRISMIDPNGVNYVLWNGTKYPLGGHSALVALGMDSHNPIAAPSNWLDALPTGTKLAPAPIPKAGTPGHQVAGAPAKVGQLFQTTAAGIRHYYVLRADGIAPITATESALLAAGTGGHAPRRVASPDIAAVNASADRSLLNRIPDLLSDSDFTADGAALCLKQSLTDGTTHSTVVRETGQAAAPGTRIMVPAGRGLIAIPPKESPNDTTPQPYLISDRGVKYPLAADGAVKALGYANAVPRTLPKPLLDLLPSGPLLTRAKATATVSGE
jgi:type VII secretion protein EccB